MALTVKHNTLTTESGSTPPIGAVQWDEAHEIIGTVSLATEVAGTLPIANGGTNATSASAALTSLGAYPATNPSGYTANVGTVTSVAGAGTVSGLTLTGSVTSTGSLTLGGTLSLTSGNVTTALGYTPYDATNPSAYLSTVSLTSNVTGTLPAANGGTGLASSGTAGNVLTSNGTAWVSQLPAAGGITYTTVKTANFTAAANDGVQTNTTGGAFTVTLPATPALGAQVVVADSAGSWATNNLTVGRNGSTIEGAASDLTCDISGVSVQFVYNGTTWDVFAQAGGAGAGVTPVTNGGTGATTLTGYVKGSGTSTMTASATIPTSDLSGTIATSSLTGLLPVANGGTNANNIGDARTNLGLATVAATGAYADLTGKPTLTTGDVVGPSSATDNALARYDLTTGKLLQNSLVTVSDTGEITAPSVGSVIPFYFANQAAFPSASSYHGAIAHSHSDGKMYFAHGAAWNALANATQLFSGAYADLTGKPTIPTVVSALTNDSAYLSTVSLTTNVTGTLPVANGGTGAATLTGYVKGTGTSAMTASAAIPVADVTGAAPLASPTFTGTVTTATADLLGPVRGNIVTVAALDIDCSAGNYFTKTIAGNSTFTFSNVPASRAFAFTLELTHTSGLTTWPASVKWPGDTAPTLATGKTHLFTFVTDDGGTRWRGVAQKDYVN